MALALAVGSSRVRTTMPSSPRSHLTAESEFGSLMSLFRSRGGGRSDELDDGGDAHAAADAQRGQAALAVATLELVDEGAEDHRAGGTQRVTHGDRSSVDVGDLVADAHVPHEAHGHGGEGLV